VRRTLWRERLAHDGGLHEVEEVLHHVCACNRKEGRVSKKVNKQEPKTQEESEPQQHQKLRDVNVNECEDGIASLRPIRAPTGRVRAVVVRSVAVADFHLQQSKKTTTCTRSESDENCDIHKESDETQLASNKQRGSV
jgi:hypothetical protein